jgi:hypothetical protein
MYSKRARIIREIGFDDKIVNIDLEQILKGDLRLISQ